MQRAGSFPGHTLACAGRWGLAVMEGELTLTAHLGVLALLSSLEARAKSWVLLSLLILAQDFSFLTMWTALDSLQALSRAPLLSASNHAWHAVSPR